MKKFHRQHSGVTLVELLMYIAIATILLGAIATLESTIFQARQRLQAQVAVEEQGLAAMTTIARLIRNSSATDNPAIGGTASLLTLTVPAAVASPTKIDISNNVLRLTEGTTPPQALQGGKVSATTFQVKNLGSVGMTNTLHITLTLQAAWGRGNVYTQTFITTAVQRLDL